MAAASDYLENKILDLVLRNRSFSPPAALYVALHTASPGDSASPTNEVSGGSYARVQHGPSDTTWEATQGGTPAAASSGTSGASQNAGTITFPAPTANWGTVTHWSLWDAATGGNMLIHGALAASKAVNNGDPAPVFAAGAIDITLA